MTDSELLFEAFCCKRSLLLERIPEGEARSPDYWIHLGRTRIVVEVKEVDVPPREKVILQKMAAGEIDFHAEDVRIGQLVRNKIRKASKQIRQFVRNGEPAILVLYNNRVLTNPLNAYELRDAMYGRQVMIWEGPVQAESSLGLPRKEFGPGRSMTDFDNTSLSAVGVLDKEEGGPTSLRLYHNEHATSPLDHCAFCGAGIRHFVLEEGEQSEFREWLELKF